MHFNFEDHAVFKILLTIRVVNSTTGTESDIDIVTAMVTVIVIVFVS